MKKIINYDNILFIFIFIMNSNHEMNVDKKGGINKLFFYNLLQL